jgi:hypothetical protein
VAAATGTPKPTKHLPNTAVSYAAVDSALPMALVLVLASIGTLTVAWRVRRR